MASPSCDAGWAASLLSTSTGMLYLSDIPNDSLYADGLGLAGLGKEGGELEKRNGLDWQLDSDSGRQPREKVPAPGTDAKRD